MTDPYTWLEDANSDRAMAFARAENARSLPQLQSDPRYAGNYSEALKLVTAKDRIPGVSFHGDGSLRDFWQDADHVHGLWRTTTIDSYMTGEPQFKTLIDFDQLAAADKINWVFKGAHCLSPGDRLCLLGLSDGGADAVTVRANSIPPPATSSMAVSPCRWASRTSPGSIRTP